MARKNVANNESVDWYLISIDRLKKIGLVVFLALLAGGIWFYVSRERGNPRTTAEGAIADARQALNSLASSKDFNAHHAEFDRAQKKLDDASSLFGNKKYAEAQASAFESQTIARTAINGGGDQENDARFLTLEGDVEYQKGSTGDWLRADLRTPLVNGDWVKTHDSASAELMFQNGSLYTVGPNALLEIYSTVNAQTARKTNSVQMKFGSVEVATVNDQSTVRTPGSQVVVDSESTTQVGVNKADAQTSVMSVRGTASVAPAAGGETVKITAGDKVNATGAGAVGAVKKLLMPPALSNPPDNQVFSITLDTEIRFQWQPQAGAVAYQLQVSRSRLFSTLEINSRRTKLQATAKVESEGIFYWRVASIGADGEMGPFSPFRRFRVSGGGKNGAPSATADSTPPPLALKAPFNIGGQFYIIEGNTEPGATIFVNDEEADVESSGHFKKLVSFNKVGQNTVVVKAVDAAGNQTVKSQTVLVEE
jgi:glucodextranase-like protein